LRLEYNDDLAGYRIKKSAKKFYCHHFNGTVPFELKKVKLNQAMN
jgi:hypothetical protein